MFRSRGFRYPVIPLIFVVFYLSCNKVGNTDGNSNNDEADIPIDLVDLGYFSGDWAKFCDRNEIQEEFAYFPDHEVKKVRLIICQIVWEQKRYGNESIAACAFYKYCTMMRSRVDIFVDHFLDAFSMDDEEKRLNLTRRTTFNHTTLCYNTSMAKFDEKCIAPENAFNSMFKQIFGIACTYEKLTTEKIVSTIEEVCDGRYMTDKIDWMPYVMSIPLKKSQNHI